jgi:hypothetical protein
VAITCRAITYLRQPGSPEGLVKGVSRAGRGRRQARDAPTLHEPEGGRTIAHVMARETSITRSGLRVLADTSIALERRSA